MSNYRDRAMNPRDALSEGSGVIDQYLQAMAKKWLDHHEDALLEQYYSEPQKPSGKWIVDIKVKPTEGNFEVSVIFGRTTSKVVDHTVGTT